MKLYTRVSDHAHHTNKHAQMSGVRHE